MEGRKNPSGSVKTSTPTHPTKQQELEGGRGRGGNSSEANGRGFRVTGVDGTHYKGESIPGKRGRRVLPRAAYKKGWPWAKPADMGRQRSQLGLQREYSS